MDQNNEQFRPEENNSQPLNESSFYAPDGFVPTEQAPTPKKRRKLARILWISAAGLVLVAAIVAAVLFVPILTPNVLKNTVSALAFDPDVLEDLADLASGWAENGSQTSVKIHLPSEDPKTLQDYDIQLDATQIGSSPDKAAGKVTLTLGSDSTSLPLTVYYDSDTVAISGLSEDPNRVYSLPRKNAREKLDASVFHPDSGSDFSLDKESYDSLASFLDLLSTDTEPDKETKKQQEVLEKSFDKIQEAIETHAEPKTSIYFAKGSVRLCRRVEYTVDKNALDAILNVIIAEAESNRYLEEWYQSPSGLAQADAEVVAPSLAESLKTLKNQISTLNFKFSYVVSGGKITELKLDTTFSANFEIEGNAHLTVDGDMDLTVDFTYDKENTGFDATVESNTEKYPSTFVYRKTETDGTTELSLKHTRTVDRLVNGGGTAPAETSKTYIFTHRAKGGTYDFVTKNYDDKAILEIRGECKIDKKDGLLRLSVDQVKIKDTELFEQVPFTLSISECKKKPQLTMPSHTPLMDMSDVDVFTAIRSVPMADIQQLLLDWTGVEVEYPSSADGKLLFVPKDLETATNDYFTKYMDFGERTQQSGGTVPRGVYIYDETWGIYILWEYTSGNNQVRGAYFFELTDEIKNNCAEAKIIDGQMVLQ